MKERTWNGIACFGKQSIEANKYQPIKNTKGLMLPTLGVDGGLDVVADDATAATAGKGNLQSKEFC